MSEELIENLCALGFSEYEARAYLHLAKSGAGNGYEVARGANIPRPNVYGVLDRLIAKGAARKLLADESVRYAATPPGELLDALERKQQQTLASVRARLAEFEPPDLPTDVLNIYGYDALVDGARALLGSAKTEALLAVGPPEAQRLQQDVAGCAERHCDLTTLCVAGCPTECGGCRGKIYRFPLLEGLRRWLVLVVDRRRMLAGEITAAGDAHGVTTAQPLVVEMAEGFIRRSVLSGVVLAKGGVGEGEPELARQLRSLGAWPHAGGAEQP